MSFLYNIKQRNSYIVRIQKFKKIKIKIYLTI